MKVYFLVIEPLHFQRQIFALFLPLIKHYYVVCRNYGFYLPVNKICMQIDLDYLWSNIKLNCLYNDLKLVITILHNICLNTPLATSFANQRRKQKHSVTNFMHAVPL